MLERPLQQYDANAKRTRGGNLPVGRLPAAVLRDHHLDAVRRQQFTIRSLAEGTASENVLCVRQGQRRLDGIHRSYEVAMLRLRCERSDLLPAYCEKHMLRFRAERSGCGLGIGYLRPAIAGYSLPRRSTQTQQRRIGLQSRLHGVRGNRLRIRMGGIDQHLDAMVTQISDEPRYTAKATASRRHGLCERRCRTTGERQRHVQVFACCETGRELPRFGRAAENQ